MQHAVLLQSRPGVKPGLSKIIVNKV